MNASVEFFRACDVHSHVTLVAKRIGCDGAGTRRAQIAADKALREGKSPLKAVREAIYVAAAHVEITKRMHEMDALPTPRDHFWRDLILDCLGLLGLIVISVIAVGGIWAFMGRP